jgi:hypothetical protein
MERVFDIWIIYFDKITISSRWVDWTDGNLDRVLRIDTLIIIMRYNPGFPMDKLRKTGLVVRLMIKKWLDMLNLIFSLISSFLYIYWAESGLIFSYRAYGVKIKELSEGELRESSEDAISVN